MLKDETPASGDESPLEGGWEPPKETIVESRCVNEVAAFARGSLLKDGPRCHTGVLFRLGRQFESGPGM